VQTLNYIFFISSLQVLMACSPVEQKASTRFILDSRNECESIYKSKEAVLVENFCNTENKPVSIQLSDQKILTDWINEETSRFLHQEGCAEDGECFYEFHYSKSILQGRFVYTVNLTEGEYRFEIGPAGQIRILSESSSDIAS
jgi:hypothetical protein